MSSQHENKTKDDVVDTGAGSSDKRKDTVDLSRAQSIPSKQQQQQAELARKQSPPKQQQEAGGRFPAKGPTDLRAQKKGQAIEHQRQNLAQHSGKRRLPLFTGDPDTIPT